MDPETATAIGSELIRIDSILRINPQHALAACNDKPHAMILLAAACNETSPKGRTVALIQQWETTSRAELTTYELTIRSLI